MIFLFKFSPFCCFLFLFGLPFSYSSPSFLLYVNFLFFSSSLSSFILYYSLDTTLLTSMHACLVFSLNLMSEKGGKGFSLAKGAPLKGKDDDSKSKKARKVQFADEESPANFSSKSGGKGETPQGGKGGKNSVPKEVKYDLNVQPELPKNAQCIMDCEAADILQGIQEQMVFLSRDPSIKLPIPFDRGLQYAKSGAQYSDPKAVRQVLVKLKKYGASDDQMCVIANTCPETIDEVFALLPSLKAKKTKISEPLKDALAELVKLKLSTEVLEE